MCGDMGYHPGFTADTVDYDATCTIILGAFGYKGAFNGMSSDDAQFIRACLAEYRQAMYRWEVVKVESLLAVFDGLYD